MHFRFGMLSHALKNLDFKKKFGCKVMEMEAYSEILDEKISTILVATLAHVDHWPV